MQSSFHGPVLGIESSCDETAAAVLDTEGHVLAEAILSQEREHAPFGGVVPEIAARAHLAHLPALVQGVMLRAGVDFPSLGAVAASAGPGLIGGLIVGSQFAKGIAIAHGAPYIAVNHLEAHALTARLPGLVEGGAPFPYLLLLISGGHCQCVVVEAVGQYRCLGRTVDDAAGEAFDKVAKLLGLSWPGGPALERLALGGDPKRFAFPRPMLGREGCDFSFSGLKTAVAQTVAKLAPAAMAQLAPAAVTALAPIAVDLAADVAAGFQQAVTDVLADRASHAMRMMRARTDASSSRGQEPLFVVAGGVAANQTVRRGLQQAASAHGFRLAAPPIRLCTDNAVMVAWAGLERLRLGLTDAIDFAPRPRWPLEALVR